MIKEPTLRARGQKRRSLYCGYHANIDPCWLSACHPEVVDRSDEKNLDATHILASVTVKHPVTVRWGTNLSMKLIPRRPTVPPTLRFGWYVHQEKREHSSATCLLFPCRASPALPPNYMLYFFLVLWLQHVVSSRHWQLFVDDVFRRYGQLVVDVFHSLAIPMKHRQLFIS